MSYGITTTVDATFEEAVEAVREALSAQGFGILTQIDLAGTLNAKLGVDVAPHVILGACNPPLALRALQVEDSIGLLLPCNVVIRSTDAGQTVIEALDPQVMVDVTGNDRLRSVAEDAAGRLRAALVGLGS
jgi:uncharacterized protein (DUF302 family)